MATGASTTMSAAMLCGLPRSGINLARPVALRLLSAVGANDLFVAVLD